MTVNQKRDAGSSDFPDVSRNVTRETTREAAWILSRLEKGERIIVEAGAFRMGDRQVTTDVVNILRSRDLLGPLDAGCMVINDRGRAFLRRTRAARQRRKAARAGDNDALVVHDPYRDQHLALSRRAGLSSEGHGMAEPRQKQGKQTYWVNDGESPLGWLRRRRDRNGRPLISVEQAEAGERLRVDFELAGLSPRVTAAWDGAPVTGGKSAYRELEPTEVQVMARRRLNRALEALGPGLSDIAVHSCCLLEGLAQAERRLGWPARSGKVVLGLALDRLANHYGLTKRTNMENSA